MGSVFGAWDLIEAGFVELLSKHLKNFRLLRLRKSSAFGAAKFAAKETGFDLNIGQTTELLYAFSKTSDGYHANGRHVITNMGSASNDNSINGHLSNGNTTNGHRSNGHSINGHPSNGRQSNGPSDDTIIVQSQSFCRII